ncbi:hypothetical protein B0H13DRAFT_2362593 [Mycena leptocephala]|nr:hypothetical protein B0H13DRAFT_2362593 [Mycena leptocephala]
MTPILPPSSVMHLVISDSEIPSASASVYGAGTPHVRRCTSTLSPHRSAGAARPRHRVLAPYNPPSAREPYPHAALTLLAALVGSIPLPTHRDRPSRPSCRRRNSFECKPSLQHGRHCIARIAATHTTNTPMHRAHTMSTSRRFPIVHAARPCRLHSRRSSARGGARDD